jgi:hypothetical protein
MPNIVTTTAPQKNTVKAMQIRALEERRKAAEIAAAKAVQPQVVESPWQGVGNMVNAFFTARRGANLEAQEQSSREALAKLRSGWGPEGPNMAQIQEAAAYDEELANKLQSELQQRNFTRAQQEDTQAHQTQERIAGQGFTTSERIGGQEFTKAQNESDQEFELRKQTARNEFEKQQAETKVKTDQDAAAAAAEVDAKAAKLIADAKIAEPDSPEGKIVADYMGGKFGQPDSPEAKQRLNDAWEKETYIAPPVSKDVTTTAITGYDTQGRPIFETTTGPRGGGAGGGGGSGIGGGGGSQADITSTLSDYRKRAVAATNQNANIDAMEKSLASAGPLGLPAIGEAASKAESVMDWLSPGFRPDWWQDWMGSSGARATMEQGSLAFVQQQVADYKGAISDKETALFRASGPGLNKTKEGNKVLLALGREVNKRAVQQATEAEKWAAANKGTLGGFAEHWNSLIENDPIMDEDPTTHELIIGGQRTGITSTGDPLPGGGAATPPQSGGGAGPPPGAKIFKYDKDGNLIQ